MGAYLSASFEKTVLTTSGQVRVIVKNRDDGDVPPAPSTNFFPTDPGDMQSFIVANYSGSAETYISVATVAELSSITARALDTVEDTTVDFVAAAVIAGDVIKITVADPQPWTSNEYPGTNPFSFTVDAILSTTKVRLTRPMPAFYNGFTWTIERVSLTGYAGKTLRNGSPSPGLFRDSRFNRLFDNAIEAENAVTAMKADMLTLTNEAAGAGLTNETVTVSSTV
jgi:hypothetical protein